jgi:hypothetical protein
MLFNVDGITSDNSIVGNVFIDGKNTSALPIRLNAAADGAKSNAILAGTRLYLADNLASNATSDAWSIVQNQSPIDLSKLRLAGPPAWPDGLDALPTKDGVVLAHVLENVGARPAGRDSVDARVIADVRKGTGQIINCVEDDGSSKCAKNAGGWPTLAKNSRPLYVPGDPNGDDDRDGYTNMEEWLHTIAAEVEGRAKPGPEDGMAPPMPPELQN